jgi:hypothetical protein
MKLGFKKIIFCKKIPKSPFLSNLYNKRIQSKLKVEETKLNFLIDQVKNKHSFVRNYSMFNKSITKLPLILKNNNHNLNKDYSCNSYLNYNKKLSPEFKSINSDILNNVKKLFKVEKQLINEKKRQKKIIEISNNEIKNII